MIRIWKRRVFETFFEDFETKLREDLLSLGIKITFNNASYPFVDIEFYDEEDKVTKFLENLARQGKINILDTKPEKTNTTKVKIRKVPKRNKVRLSKLQKTVVKIFKIPY